MSVAGRVGSVDGSLPQNDLKAPSVPGRMAPGFVAETGRFVSKSDGNSRNPG